MSIEHRLPVLLLGSGPHVVGAVARDTTGRALEAPRFAYEALPADAVTVDARGQVTCLRSYDGVLTVRTGAQERLVSARCRLPASIRGAPSIDLGRPARDGPVARFVAYDAGGVALNDVPVELISSDPEVATVDGATLRGLRPGVVTVSARAGELAATLPLRVEAPLVVTVTFPARRPDGTPWDPSGLPDPHLRVGEREAWCWNSGSCRMAFSAPTATGPVEVHVDETDAGSEPAGGGPVGEGPSPRVVNHLRLLPHDADQDADDVVGTAPCLVSQPCSVGGAEVWIRPGP